VKTTLFLLHGFNDQSAGEDNINKTEPLFRSHGYDVNKDDMKYGFYSYWMVRFYKRPAIQRIIKAVNVVPIGERVVVICYSNGAHYLRKSLPHFNKRVIVIFCSAALNRKAKFHSNLGYGWCFYIKNDFTVWLASFIPFKGWGRMGAVGYQGNNKLITNIDYTDIASGHGGMFKQGVIGLFVDHVHRLLTKSK
jgi:hypothetical protein